MELIGQIVHLQVQRSSLKVGEPRRYDPAPLWSLAALALTGDGVSGRAEDGAEILDVHNRTHPESKNIRGVNGVSVGFTAHYAAMRGRFGSHLAHGIAGENILVATEQPVALMSLANGLLIQGQNGSGVRLVRVRVAEPCLEFSRYAERLPAGTPPDDRVMEALQFLREGRRGYYASLDGAPGVVRMGDSVYRL